MEKLHILLMRPEGDEASPADQSLGARLAADVSGVIVQEEQFRRDDAADLDRKLARWEGKVSGVVGATNVPESRQLGELAERMNLLCFVANNNPEVWQNRKQVFHLGLPTSQTTAAVAAEVAQDSGRRRFLLLHDQNEFQRRVAAGLETALRGRGKDVRAQQHVPGDTIAIDDGWKPDAIHIIFSSERKALPIVRNLRTQAAGVPLVLGRSLLRQSFLDALGKDAGEIWFTDTTFRHGALRSESQRTFMQAMPAHGVDIPTTNHAFGWDGMKFCAHALKAAAGDTLRAIDYLESGVTLQGASGTCSFSPDNHNGRLEPAPTVLTRWAEGKLDELHAHPNHAQRAH